MNVDAFLLCLIFSSSMFFGTIRTELTMTVVMSVNSSLPLIKMINDLKQSYLSLQQERMKLRRKKEKQSILYRKLLRNQVRQSRF
jgi:hypothetical protein